MGKDQLNATELREELNDSMVHTILPVTIFIGVELFFGFFGNILILTVYSRRYKRTNFRYFVLSMAVLDLTSCCTTLPGEIFSQLNWYDYRYDWVCRVKSYFNVFTAWGSASILLTLAVDRYRKICRPFKWQIQPAHALKLCGFTFILSFLVSIPVAVFWGKQGYVYDHDGYNITVFVCEKSGKYADTIYPLVYIGSVYFLPVGSMIFVAGTMNILIARKLFGHKLIKVQSVKKYSLSSVASTAVTSAHSGPDALGHTNDLSEDRSNGMQQTDTGSSGPTALKHADMDHSKGIHLQNCKRKHNTRSGFDRKRKTIIMLVLTSVFVVTMAVYVILISLVAVPDGLLKEMSDSTKVVFLFFLRLYFINCVVNPILYGFMDPRFRSGLLSYVHKQNKHIWIKPNLSQSSH